MANERNDTRKLALLFFILCVSVPHWGTSREINAPSRHLLAGGENSHGIEWADHVDSLSLFFGIIISITMIVDFSLHKLNHSVEKFETLSKLVSLIYREMIILGFIAIFAFVASEKKLLDSIMKKFSENEGDASHIFEMVHFFALAFSITYLLFVASMMVMGTLFMRDWFRFDSVSRDRQEVKKTLLRYVHLTEKYDETTPMQRIVEYIKEPHSFVEVCSLLTTVEYIYLRFAFIQHHRLPRSFRFDRYLQKCMRETSLDLAEIHWSIWVALLVFAFLNWVRFRYITEFGPDTIGGICVGLVNLLMLCFFVMFAKLRHIERSIIANMHLDPMDIPTERQHSSGVQRTNSQMRGSFVYVSEVLKNAVRKQRPSALLKDRLIDDLQGESSTQNVEVEFEPRIGAHKVSPDRVSMSTENGPGARLDLESGSTRRCSLPIGALDDDDDVCSIPSSVGKSHSCRMLDPTAVFFSSCVTFVAEDKAENDDDWDIAKLFWFGDPHFIIHAIQLFCLLLVASMFALTYNLNSYGGYEWKLPPLIIGLLLIKYIVPKILRKFVLVTSVGDMSKVKWLRHMERTERLNRGHGPFNLFHRLSPQEAYRTFELDENGRMPVDSFRKQIQRFRTFSDPMIDRLQMYIKTDYDFITLDAWCEAFQHMQWFVDEDDHLYLDYEGNQEFVKTLGDKSGRDILADVGKMHSIHENSANTSRELWTED